MRRRGGTPYGIPAGASDHRLGELGFANWAYEVQQQEEELGVFFDTVVVCSVTALVDLVRDGDIPEDSQVLYAHLGGQPALSAYSGLFPS
jgi:1-aminocyclopropane-1-carboxylate deaminase/D-cysteine desulfhydrase-like pyridoxal-dependent ACC family enzyme